MPQYKDAYNPSIHEYLDKVDWDAVFPEVLKYAVWRAKQFIWLGDKIDPESLVQEAIARAYGIGSGGAYRNWNRETCPNISTFLIGIIRSITSHKVEHDSAFPTESLYSEDGSPKDDTLFKQADETIGILKPKTPEEGLIASENLQSLMEKLNQISDEDENLGLIILCIQDGISKPMLIAAETGLEITQVNYLLKRLRRNLKNCNPISNKNLPKKGGKNGHR